MLPGIPDFASAPWKDAGGRVAVAESAFICSRGAVPHFIICFVNRIGRPIMKLQSGETG